MEGTAVLIDAHYLDLIAKELGFGGEKHIDIKELAIRVSKQNNLWLNQVFLYTCPPFQSSRPTSDESIRKAKYDKFKAAMERRGVIIREGRLQKLKIEKCGNTDYKFTEKGVDTLFTMDLLRLYKSGIRNAILLTCDTDFVPVINEAKKDGTKVILYYYTDENKKGHFSLSYHLSKACDSKVLITKELVGQSVLH